MGETSLFSHSQWRGEKSWASRRKQIKGTSGGRSPVWRDRERRELQYIHWVL